MPSAPQKYMPTVWSGRASRAVEQKISKMLLLMMMVILAGFAQALTSDTLLLGLTQFVQRENVKGTECVEQLRTLHAARQEQQSWALKAFDASGGGYANLLLGHSFWLGNPLTCRGVNEPLLQDFTQRQSELLRQLAPFGFDYRVVYVDANSSWQLALSVKEPPLLHIGICVPHSCDQWQLEQLLRPTLAGQHMQLVTTKQPALSAAFLASSAFRWLLLLLAAMLLLTLLGFSRWAARSRFVACFDVAANWRRLWQLPAGGQDIGVINGLRVCSAFVLLCFHVVWYQFFSVNHSAALAAKLAKLSMQHSYLPIMVEVFFVISGFLTVSNFLGNAQLQRSIASDSLAGNLRRFVRQLAQRYLRLAPLHFVIILLSVVSFGYHRETSVFQLIEPLDELCSLHWWRNLLFVQNLYPIKEMCCNWTWSLGCDMQLHVAAMLLLYVHTRHPRLVQRLVLWLLLGNVVYTVLLLCIWDLPATFDNMYAMGDWLYTTPWVRMLTYLIGSAYGYAHARGWGAPLAALFPNRLAKCALAGVALWLGNELQTLHLASPVVLGFGMILLRSIIATGAAHIILCSFQVELSSLPTRWFVRFLELKWFQRVNRITYAIYLLNPLVILNFYYSFSDAIPADVAVLIILCVAYLAIVVVFSIPLTLFVEIPFNRLSSLLLPSAAPKDKSN